MRLFVRDNGGPRRREPLVVVTGTVRAAKKRGIRSSLWNRTRIMVPHNARAYIQVAAKHRLYLAPVPFPLLIAVWSPIAIFIDQKNDENDRGLSRVDIIAYSLPALLAALYTRARLVSFRGNGRVYSAREDDIM